MSEYANSHRDEVEATIAIFTEPEVTNCFSIIALVIIPHTHEPLGECVYRENASDKWHVPRYPTRKHCIATLSHA